MIIVTGGAGFIGSAMIWKLNQMGHKEIVVIDRLGLGEKWQNLSKRNLLNIVNIDEGHSYVEKYAKDIEAIFHMGACSSTTERDADYLIKNNVHYSINLWELAKLHQIPFLYASSAATYGAEEDNFSDDHQYIHKLRPINKYGYSKQMFDCWALQQQQKPEHWYGFKFFNVYGPGENHKGSQASVVFHAFPQILQKGRLKLFKSYRNEISDGWQQRDFVYVKDVVNVMYHFWQNRSQCQSGVYNLGSGKAHSFYELAEASFKAMEKPVDIEWIDMPQQLINQYQYFTEANLTKLRTAGNYLDPFSSLEDGIFDYINNYLNTEDCQL